MKLYDGLSLMEQLWLRITALHEMIVPLREQAWIDLTNWSGHRACRTALAALVSPLFNPASPLYPQSVAYVREEGQLNPLLQASILYHLAMGSPSEFVISRQILEETTGIFLTPDNAPLAKPGPWQAKNRWDQTVTALAGLMGRERIHWDEAPSTEKPELYDAIRQVQENPTAEQSVRRLAEAITHSKRFSPAFARRLAQACRVHLDSGNAEADARLTAALTYRLNQADDGGLYHGLLAYLTNDSSSHGWAPKLPPSDDPNRRRVDRGPYRLADIVATTPMTGVDWSMLYEYTFQEERRRSYWLALFVQKMLANCPVSSKRTDFFAHCYLAVTKAEYNSLPDGYDRVQLFSPIDLGVMVRDGNAAEATRIVLAIDQHDHDHSLRHHREDLARELPIDADIRDIQMGVVREAIGKQWVPICWLREAVKDQPPYWTQRLVRSWLRRAHAENVEIETPEERRWLATTCRANDITAGVGFMNLVAVLAGPEKTGHYTPLAVAGYVPTNETIDSFWIEPIGERGYAVPNAWLVPCLQHPDYRTTVGLPSLYLRVAAELKAEHNVATYLDAFWDEHRQALLPLLPEIVTWAWQQDTSHGIRNWLIDRANELEIWPQITELTTSQWASAHYNSWESAYWAHDRQLLERLERVVINEWYLAALDREIASRRGYTLGLNSRVIGWLFETWEHRPRLLQWLVTNLDHLSPASVIEVIDQLSLLDLPNGPWLQRWLRVQAEDPHPKLAEAAFALVRPR